MTDKITRTEQEWRDMLPPEAFRVLRNKGTEPAFSGEYWDTKAKGMYLCRACEAPLFSSDTKFDSGSGWPSFYAPVDGAVGEVADRTYGMSRVEVLCEKCDSHLGHVFGDGPKPTGRRFCINSASIELDEHE